MTLSKGRLSTQYHLVGYFYTIAPPCVPSPRPAHFLYSHRNCHLPFDWGRRRLQWTGPKLTKLPFQLKYLPIATTITYWTLIFGHFFGDYNGKNVTENALRHADGCFINTLTQDSRALLFTLFSSFQFLWWFWINHFDLNNSKLENPWWKTYFEYFK